MAHAYTPGLKVTERYVVRRVRRLPLRGQVVVKKGDRVTSDAVVARTDLPGKVLPLNVGGLLNALPEDVRSLMLKKQGDPVHKDEAIAETKGLFGMFKARCPSPIDGTVESVSARTGQVMLRDKPIGVEVRAYIDGEVVDVLEGEGATIETVAALVQGIFGLAGETDGPIRVIAGPTESLTEARITDDLRGVVAVGGSLVTLGAFKKALAVGVRALVTGGMHYRDIKDIVGYELGVAITGTEALATTLVLTEGFGQIDMARATHALLKKYEGRKASLSGATQIRAGVMRPELVVPLEGMERPATVDQSSLGLGAGSLIRGIRAPYFGRIGTVTELPVELVSMESETKVRVLCAKFEDGTDVVLPRANVEMIERR